MEEKDHNFFYAMTEKFINYYMKLCPDYVKYFVKNYLTRPDEWAMCFRTFSHGNTDTNMYVESFHNILKTFYMNRKANMRCDELLNILMIIEQDFHFNHSLKTRKENPVNPVLAPRHERGLKIVDNDVTFKDEKWEVKAQQNKNKENIEIYDIKLINDVCLE